MSWQPIDLSASEYAQTTEPPITCGLIYRGKRHALSGAPETLKTLLALIIGLEHYRGGNGPFALVDFEMGPHATRLLLNDLGATPEEIAAIHYVTPDGPPDAAAINAIVDARVTLVIVDAAAGAYDASQLDDNKRADAETFARTWVRPLWKREIATILIDHVVKNSDNRGRYAIGSERKLGAVDVHLGLEAVKQLHRGADGLIRITTHKDRPGHLARPRAAELELRSDPDTHAISWAFREASTETAADGDNFRPTVLMQRASRALELAREPISPTKLAGLFSGKREYKFRAIDTLIKEGYATATEGANRLVTFVRAFTDEQTVPGSSNGSQRFPGTAQQISSPVPTPSRGNRNWEPLGTTHERANGSLQDEIERIAAIAQEATE